MFYKLFYFVVTLQIKYFRIYSPEFKIKLNIKIAHLYIKIDKINSAHHFIKAAAQFEVMYIHYNF